MSPIGLSTRRSRRSSTLGGDLDSLADLISFGVAPAAIAFVVGEAVGLDVSQSCRDYIHLYRGDREALAGSLDRIQRAASVILTAVNAAG